MNVFLFFAINNAKFCSSNALYASALKLRMKVRVGIMELTTAHIKQSETNRFVVETWK